MNLTKIQYFDAFGAENWVDSWTNSIKVLIKNRLDVNDNGKIYRTYNDGFDVIYFYMTDKLGHTTFYRMDEITYYKQMDKLNKEFKKCER